MSKSLEALENLVHCKSELKCSTCKHKSRCTMERDYNTIKQELERLEHLEKEYKLLDETMEADDRIICQLSEEKKQLEIENQDLKSKLSAIEFWNERYIEHNEKLKKAIEILKYRLKIGLIEDMQKFDFIYYWLSLNGIAEEELTPQEYELLNEVLRK